MRPFVAVLAGSLLVSSSPLLAQTKGPAAAKKSPAPAATTQAAPAKVPEIGAAALKEEARLLSPISAADRAKIASAGKTLAKRLEQPTPAGKPAKSIEQHANDVVGSMGVTGDVTSVLFLVMMQAAKSAQEDLKSIMAGVKAINAARNCKTYGCVEAMKATAEYDKATLDSVRKRMKGKMESLAKMSEMEALRLQMAMDRMSKLMTTLSNVLKKISSTTGTVIQNLK